MHISLCFLQLSAEEATTVREKMRDNLIKMTEEWSIIRKELRFQKKRMKKAVKELEIAQERCELYWKGIECASCSKDIWKRKQEIQLMQHLVDLLQNKEKKAAKLWRRMKDNYVAFVRRHFDSNYGKK